MSTEHPIFQKIDEGTVTVDDFNKLISEASPEALRDRVRRKVKHNVTDSHQDQDGHQKLQGPQFAKRIQPKKEKNPGVQMNGQGKAAHRRSTRTQRRKAKATTESVKRFGLSFDKAGYINNLKSMLEERGYKPHKHYTLDENKLVLTVSENFQFDNELKKFLSDVGRAKRLDIQIPDIFEYKSS